MGISTYGISKWKLRKKKKKRAAQIVFFRKAIVLVTFVQISRKGLNLSTTNATFCIVSIEMILNEIRFVT